MKAVLVTAIGEDFETGEVTLADPIGREVLVEIKASGLCHTDVTYSHIDPSLSGYPLPSLLGHELAGVVASVGPDVTEFSVGDHVVGCLVQYCGKCRKCLAGKVGQCLHPEATLRAPGEAPRISRDGEPVSQGYGLGGFAERALVHESQLVKVPDAIPFPQAALLGCGVVTGAGAVMNTADIQAGDSVVIIGAGGVGLNGVSGAIIAGATKIIVVDISDDKLEGARRWGATHTVNSAKTDAAAAVKELTDGVGADAVFDFVGIAEVTQGAIEMVAPGGGLYFIGILGVGTPIDLDTFGAILNQRKFQGVNMGSTVPKRDIPMIAELYLQGRFNLDDLVSKEISLDQVNEGYASLKDPTINRVVITSF